ncbi:hypothetical protein JCM8547_004765 [Rhodosporidiobolus lusitaniae]
MPPPFPTLFLSLLLLALSPSSTSAFASPSPSPAPPPPAQQRRSNPVPGVLFAGDYVCRLEGECQPCPASELSTPVCKVYGNRRALSCIPRYNNGGKNEASSSFNSHASSPSHLTPEGDDEPDPRNPDAGNSKPLGGAAGHAARPGLSGGAGGNEEGKEYFLAPGLAPGLSQSDLADVEEEDEPFLDSSEGELGQTEAEEDEEVGRLRGDFEAEEEMRMAVEEVEKELSPGMGAGGREKRRLGRRRRFVLDEEEYERVLKERRRTGGGGVEKRQGGVQLKVQAWEACPKVLKKEKEDFFEYILCNLFFALLSLSVLAYRQRTLALRQFGRLAARIMQTEVTAG